jgi:hypothetical protein
VIIFARSTPLLDGPRRSSTDRRDCPGLGHQPGSAGRGDVHERARAKEGLHMEGTVVPFMMDIEVDTFDRYHAGSPW